MNAMPQPGPDEEPLREEQPPPRHPHRARNLFVFGVLWTIDVYKRQVYNQFLWNQF